MKKKVIFPLNIFTYAYKGIVYCFKVLTGKSPNKKKKVQKLEGDALAAELQKVKEQSNEYKRNEVRIEKEQKILDKNEKLTQFKYIVKASNGEKIKGDFDAETKDDVRIFLTNNGYEIISIEPKKKYEININIGSNKIKNNDLAFMLTQLSTYVKAGISLIDSVKILSKQTTKPNQRRILDKVVFELVMGEKFSTSLEKQGNVFPRLLINMVKTSEMTGDLAGTLDEMSDYYTQTEKVRKQMMSALIYPSVILSLTIAALVFIIVTVVPQFVSMFESNNAQLPWITKFIISLSSFLTKNWYIIALVLLAILIVYRTLFKNVKSFRKTMQKIFMKLPVIGNVIIYNEVTNFTRTFSSLLSHNVFITDSMEILSTISDNEIYKEIINRTLIGLSKGNKISDSFKGEWAFPLIAYEMLVTGENTGQLALMMEKVADHYQNLHENAVTAIKSLLEPIIICILALGVGFIVLSIIMPMFDLYQQI
ncbi:MAG: type II secretion system F family protein [bacterium]|nr:type II secretion system F family protein [bacterium]